MFGARGVSSVTLGSLPPVLLALALGRRVSRKSACKDRSSLGSISRFVSARQLDLIYDRDTSLLLFVVDASDPTHESQLEVSRNALREIGAVIVPSRLLLNKIDRVGEADRAALRAKHPDAILLSANSPQDAATLRETIIGFFEAAMVEDELVLPYAKQGFLNDVYENARVLSEDYDSTGRIMKIRGLPGAVARLRRTLAAS